jgi:uncharacterized membrane protein YphA (DoxX/SURF4 family)
MESTLTLQPKWNTPTLVAFRFVFAYFVIYIVPFPFYWIPYSGIITEPLHKVFFALTEYFGKFILDAAYVNPPNDSGSGDTTFHYVQLLLVTLMASIITIIWSVIDRKCSNYEKLLYWFIILLRYYLAITMLSYGFAKVFRTQFPPLTIGHLSKTYGDSSPMNLLWTFMGYSGTYTIFAGLGEVVGGLLLLFRRTQLLGALTIVVVMSQVVMLNFSYDVPVKLYSSHLLLMAIIIMTPDAKRLLNFFIFNQTADPQPAIPLYNNRQKKWIYFAVKSLVLIYLVGNTVSNNWNQKLAIKEYFARTAVDNSIDGQYEIETFILNNDTLPAVQSDTRRWKEMMISGKEIKVQSMDGAFISWHFLGNVGYRRMVIHSPDLATYGNFTFRSDSTQIIIEGTLLNDTLNIVAHKKSGNGYLLVNRGFHWVNEYPFNK